MGLFPDVASKKAPKLEALLSFFLAAEELSASKPPPPPHILPPAPATFNVKIMALGDSITRGVYSSDNGGYRSYLSESLNQDGFAHQWVGRASDGPPIAKYSEGWPGETIRLTDTQNIVGNA